MGNWSPPASGGSASTETSGDTILSPQKGTTGTGQESSPMAPLWERGLSLMENEPTTSQADSGLMGMSWTDTNAQETGTISAVPGPVSQVGRWPIGGEIHGRLAGQQNEKNLGPGAERKHLDGEVDHGGVYY